MRQAAFWSGYGRGACGVVAAACVGLAVAGCSSSISRFDFPSFNLTNSAENNSSADLATTAALPLPEESVYSSGGDAQLTRASQPPPSYSPRPGNAAYSPAPAGRMGAVQATYPDQASPRAEPAVLRANQVQGARIKVAKGDTLSILARRHDVTVEAIMSANNLPDGRLAVGQELIIPGAKAAKAAKPVVAAKDISPPVASAAPEVRVVKTMTIPAPGTSLAEEEEQGTQATAPAAEAKSEAKGTADGQADDVAASSEITGQGGTRVASNDQLPTPDPMSGNSFRWPVKGRIIAEFGARPDGGHNDGIDVAVPQGTSVKAAENGVVAYAGNELKGYGNLVLVRHANNWVSAYANNEELLVKRGDKVRRGQIIAKAGATGAVSQPQVHFELRKGSRPVDPTKYMSDAAASAD